MKRYTLSEILTLPVRGLIELLAQLPLRALYAFSGLVFFVLYRLLGYRKKVVLQNLRNSFPEKTAVEIESIVKEFYRHLSHLFAEVPWLLSVTEKKMRRRLHFARGSGELLDHYFEQGRSVLLVTGHYGNWEWLACAFNLFRKHPLAGPYHPIHNRVIDRMFLKFRTAFGTIAIPMQQFGKRMMQLSSQPHAFLMIADQSPVPEHALWMDFLNQDTPVFKGAEKLAAKLKMPVFFVAIRPDKPGYYKVEVTLLTEHPHELADGELTRLHTLALESEIRKAPQYWLWSHRRWKHKRLFS